MDIKYQYQQSTDLYGHFVHQKMDIPLEKECRICLKSATIYIFNETFCHAFKFSEISSIPVRRSLPVYGIVKVNKNVNFQIYPDDGLPQYLCTICVAKLNSAYEFRNEIQITDEQLREKITAKFKFNSSSSDTSRVHNLFEPEKHSELKEEQEESIMFDDVEPIDDTPFDNYDAESIALQSKAIAPKEDAEMGKKTLPEDKPASRESPTKTKPSQNRDQKRLMCDVCGKICLYKGKP